MEKGFLNNNSATKGSRSIGKSNESVSSRSGGVNLSSSNSLADQTRTNEDLMKSIAARLWSMSRNTVVPTFEPASETCDDTVITDSMVAPISSNANSSNVNSPKLYKHVDSFD